MAFAFIHKALAAREQQGLLRTNRQVDSDHQGVICIAGQHYLNFASNDYLGMRQHPQVLQSWVEGLACYGAGSGASPLVTGYSKAHAELEAYLAAALEREDALLFSSGFAANQALCQGLFQAANACGDIIADKLIHASFVDGALGTKARLRRFKHNDCEHLAKLLAGAAKSGENDILVATEGVFSMDGDTAPLANISALCQQHHAWLMLDDAHGFGVLGESGLGSAEHFHLPQAQLPVLLLTFGKAVGTAGACVLGSKALIAYLRNFAKHYIYSTAMPSAQAVATLASIKLLRQEGVRQSLLDNIALFRRLASEAELPLLDSLTPIQPVLVGNAKKTLEYANRLQQLGIWVGAMRTPTVPPGSDRLRLTLSAVHAEQDIYALVDALTMVFSHD